MAPGQGQSPEEIAFVAGLRKVGGNSLGKGQRSSRHREGNRSPGKAQHSSGRC